MSGITPTFSLPGVPDGPQEKKPVRKRAGQDSTPKLQLTGSDPTPPPSLAPVPWSGAAGAALYKQVQSLPEGGTTGSPESTPKDPDKAQEQGIGRKVDRYA